MKKFSEEDTNRIIQMAWEDRTTFDAIKLQFGLTQGETEKFMRSQLNPNSFKLWRKRVSSGVGIKHLAKRDEVSTRFKCTLQRNISLNKISKR